MPRSMADPDYEYRPWPQERRERVSEQQRQRWGAPPGHATVRGIHIPFEHRPPIRYWSDYIAHHHGEEGARDWISELASRGWEDMPRIWRLFRERKAIAQTREQIRLFQWEAAHGNRNDA